MSTTNPAAETTETWRTLPVEAAEYVTEAIRQGDTSVIALDFLDWAGLTIVDEFGRANILAALNVATDKVAIPCSNCHGHNVWGRSYDGDAYETACGDCGGRGEFRIDGPVVWSHEELEAMNAVTDEDLACAAE